MLEPAGKYEEQLKKLFLDITFDPKYKYYNNCSYRDNFTAATSTWSRHEFASVHNDQVLGFIRYDIDRDSMVAFNFGALSFVDTHPVFAKDLKKSLTDIFEFFKFRKLRFSVCVGNPVEKSYDRLVARYGGRIAGVWEKEDRLIDGTYADRKWYEITREGYLKARYGINP